MVTPLSSICHFDKPALCPTPPRTLLSNPHPLREEGLPELRRGWGGLSEGHSPVLSNHGEGTGGVGGRGVPFGGWCVDGDGQVLPGPLLSPLGGFVGL